MSLIPSAVGAACSALDVVPEPPPLPPDPEAAPDAAELGVGGATVVDTRDARWISNSEGLKESPRYSARRKKTRGQWPYTPAVTILATS